MPELLIEFFSEEIPARMQKRAEEDLARAFGEKLKAAGLEPKAIRTFSGPRRLGLVIDDLPAKAADVNEEKKGPRVGAPDQAVQGFLKSAGLNSIDQAQVVEDKKGAFYVARIERAGRATADIVSEITPDIVRAFPWPKSMRSGESDLQWVRPLHNVLALFAGQAVTIAIEGVGNEAVTWGHRFHAPEKIAPKNYADYVAKLRAAKVVVERDERKRTILEGAKAACAKAGLELVDDAGLLEEVSGLSEWPVVLLGDMDPAFLDLPGEVIRLSMRTHQKYFAVRDPKSGKLAPHFVTVANIEAKDGGKAIAAGNARVLSARLNDARFFWETDKRTPLFTEERKAKLEKIVFHQKLGSVWDKVERVKALAVELCAVTGADKALVERAALLCKCDLVTETVGEFPELQGQIGRQLASLIRPTGEVNSKGAAAVSEHDSVAIAIEDHYRPLGPNDRVPEDKVAFTLALADKLDTLAAFWVIDEKPTGSSDPYALRRAALGVVRTLLENGVRLELDEALIAAVGGAWLGNWEQDALDEVQRADQQVAREGLLAFLADRLKVQLRDQGKRHDLVDAVFALGDDDLVRIVARVEALDAFLKTESGANLLAGYKRAANILAAEEKKGKGLSEADTATGLKADLLQEPAEKALYAALEKALPAARAAVEKEDFAAAMRALSELRAPVDQFFEKVLVNAEDAALRRNRLLLLSRLREALSAVADFSKIEG
ncbi:glycine--tRNA ligase subunit beta [Terricaulis sp.]|uniref:glycine--tRNA ligase subunit beta n=1 Tax=Terricaulis sp. TaxID=2768686 RepID=UPI00378379DF